MSLTVEPAPAVAGAVGPEPTREARPGGWVDRRSRWAWLAVLASLGVVFGPSLLDIASGVQTDAPGVVLLAGPLAAMWVGVSSWRAWGADRFSSDLRDWRIEVIVAFALAAGAATAWSAGNGDRMLALPLAAAALVTVLFGVPGVWRLRWSWLLLAATWPKVWTSAVEVLARPYSVFDEWIRDPVSDPGVDLIAPFAGSSPAVFAAAVAATLGVIGAAAVGIGAGGPGSARAVTVAAGAVASVAVGFGRVGLWNLIDEPMVRDWLTTLLHPGASTIHVAVGMSVALFAADLLGLRGQPRPDPFLPDRPATNPLRCCGLVGIVAVLVVVAAPTLDPARSDDLAVDDETWAGVELSEVAGAAAWLGAGGRMQMGTVATPEGPARVTIAAARGEWAASHLDVISVGSTLTEPTVVEAGGSRWFAAGSAMHTRIDGDPATVIVWVSTPESAGAAAVHRAAGWVGREVRTGASR